MAAEEFKCVPPLLFSIQHNCKNSNFHDFNQGTPALCSLHDSRICLYFPCYSSLV